MTAYAFFDLDETLIHFRGGCPNLMDADTGGFSNFRRQLQRAGDQHGLQAVAVSNMPAAQELALLHLLFGTTCAPVHWAESGAVLVRMDQYRTEIHHSFRRWTDLERPLVVAHLEQDGLIDFEPGVEVNIILVNRHLRKDSSRNEFKQRVQASFDRMPSEMKSHLKLSFGQEGHLADIRPTHVSPHGWSKLTALAQFSDHYDINWDRVSYAGDSDSDADIMDAIGSRGGYLIAVDNASPRVKDVTARYKGCITNYELIHGAYEGLFKFTEERLRKRSSSSPSNKVLIS